MSGVGSTEPPESAGGGPAGAGAGTGVGSTEPPESAGGGPAGAGAGTRIEVHLPSTLTPLFPGLTRTQHLDAATVAEALAQLDERYPGLEDRVCEPGPRLRPHIHVYVDKERADLASPLRAGSRVDVIAAISGG